MAPRDARGAGAGGPAERPTARSVGAVLEGGEERPQVVGAGEGSDAGGEGVEDRACLVVLARDVGLAGLLDPVVVEEGEDAIHAGLV